MSEEQSGGLHIDSDWKAEAQKEKERLAQEEKKSPGGGAAGGVPGAPSFVELINLLAMQAAISLGGYQGPGGERIPPNHVAAKHHIDMLDVLEQKTKGNLTDEEKRVLDAVLYELRMQYVQIVSAMTGTGGTPRRGA